MIIDCRHGQLIQISYHPGSAPRRAFASNPAMVTDTSAINRRNHSLADDEEIWLFGYGSLIFKADFPYVERRCAHVRGWARRFWQGSHDHRGTPEAPGRVVTLIAAPGRDCHGVAYRIRGAVFAHLDHREKNGYLRLHTSLHLAGGGTVAGLFYVADADNPAFLGPAPAADIARQITAARGPSGANLDYLLELAAGLRALGTRDPHIEQLLAEVSAGA